MNRPGGVERRRFLTYLGIGTAAAAGVAGSSATSAESSRAPTTPLSQIAEGSPGIGRTIWSIPTTQPLVALTFDDGPNPELTPTLLDLLESRGIVATFMVIGQNVNANPRLFDRVLDAGHQIGNHTWSHRDLTKLEDADVYEEIEACHTLIRDRTGSSPTHLRPPYGYVSWPTLKSATDLGCDTLLWSASRKVAGVGTPDTIESSLLRQIGPGSVVCLHDGIGTGSTPPENRHDRYLLARREVELEALPRVFDTIIESGLRLVTVDRLIANSQ